MTAVASPQIYDERRAFMRVHVDCTARLVTPGSYRDAKLCDLSRSGGRLLMDFPPAEGTTALLRWLEFESLCTVVWASAAACGVAFLSPIAGDVVIASEGTSFAKSRAPADSARLTQIVFGKPRAKKTPVTLINEPQEAERYSWSLILPARPTEAITPEQEMFFHGSPLAHVAARNGWKALAEALNPSVRTLVKARQLASAHSGPVPAHRARLSEISDIG